VREALLRNAVAVIVAHNHPSGVAEPSQAHVLITQRLRDALALVDIRVLDHLVVAGASVKGPCRSRGRVRAPSPPRQKIEGTSPHGRCVARLDAARPGNRLPIQPSPHGTLRIVPRAPARLRGRGDVVRRQSPGLELGRAPSRAILRARVTCDHVPARHRTPARPADRSPSFRSEAPGMRGSRSSQARCCGR
jgi:hypothetical protein